MDAAGRGYTSEPRLMTQAAPPLSPSRVKQFWEEEACGERAGAGDTLEVFLTAQAAAKYAAEPYIRPFARFEQGAGKKVLEIGVGMGADHLQWALARPRRLAGIDLTEKGIHYTRERLRARGLSSELFIANAEQLPFARDTWDIVYAWGVLHHSPDPRRAIAEVHRVLTPGGTARVMLYHRYGLAFRLIWLRHSWLEGQPARSFDDVMRHEVESYGTEAYDQRTILEMFSGFRQVTCAPVITGADLLEGPIGRRHGGPLLELARRVWPRWALRRLPGWIGSFLLINAIK